MGARQTKNELMDKEWEFDSYDEMLAAAKEEGQVCGDEFKESVDRKSIEVFNHHQGGVRWKGQVHKMAKLKQGEFELESVKNQKNPAIPPEAKKVVRVSGDIFVWLDIIERMFYAVGPNFVNLQESIYGTGDTSDEAINIYSDEERDRVLSGRPESTQDGSDWIKKQSESIDKGLIQDAAGGNTEPPVN